MAESFDIQLDGDEKLRDVMINYANHKINIWLESLPFSYPILISSVVFLFVLLFKWLIVLGTLSLTAVWIFLLKRIKLLSVLKINVEKEELQF